MDFAPCPWCTLLPHPRQLQNEITFYIYIYMKMHPQNMHQNGIKKMLQREEKMQKIKISKEEGKQGRMFVVLFVTSDHDHYL